MATKKTVSNAEKEFNSFVTMISGASLQYLVHAKYENYQAQLKTPRGTKEYDLLVKEGKELEKAYQKACVSASKALGLGFFK